MFPFKTILAACWYMAVELCPRECHIDNQNPINFYNRVDQTLNIHSKDIKGTFIFYFNIYRSMPTLDKHVQIFLV